jgi:hypothetical protein
MNTMHMPGFTAEASFYTMARHYQWIRNPSAESGKHGVIPQQFALPYSSGWIEHCFYVAGYKICGLYNWCIHLW